MPFHIKPGNANHSFLRGDQSGKNFRLAGMIFPGKGWLPVADKHTMRHLSEALPFNFNDIVRSTKFTKIVWYHIFRYGMIVECVKFYKN